MPTRKLPPRQRHSSCRNAETCEPRRVAARRGSFIAGSTLPVRTQWSRTMTRAAYLKALRGLNLRPYGLQTQAALGLARRQLARLAAGDQDVPVPIALLLAMDI